MPDVLSAVEAARRTGRVKQAELAGALGITQGHYSKVLAGKVNLSGKLETKMSEWLTAGEHPVSGDAKSKRIRELTVSIRNQCVELMQLAGDTENIH